MTPPEPVMDASDEGSAPRRRLDSMIAGRRRASDAPSTSRSSRSSGKSDEKAADQAADKGDEKSDDKGTSSRSSSSRSRTRSDGDEKPARRRRSASESRETTDDDDKPRVRRGRRGGTGRTRDEEAPRSEEQPDASSEAVEPKGTTGATDTTDTTEVEEKPVRRRRRTETSGDGADGNLGEIRQAVARQEAMLLELAQGIDQLGTRIVNSGYRPRVAIFVDVPNLIYGYEGDGFLNMGKLLQLITEGRDLVRATAYSPVSDDPREPVEQQRFVAPFVPHEYRIVTKPLKRFSDGSIKGNFDVEMAVDMVMMADRVDVICIVSGDADFARAVEVVQQKGVRVEVVAFAGSTSIEMRALADHYFELDKVVKQIL